MMSARLLVTVLAVAVATAGAYGSCKRANMCCNGRDSSCVVVDRHFQDVGAQDPADDHAGEKVCYCDHACLKVGDCCHDFQEVCGAVSCEVSPWGTWSECSVECGIGVMLRERSVLRPASNGGSPCPELSQKRSCFGTHCEEKKHMQANREIAIILPATFSNIRQLNASQDIRSNLRLRYNKNPDEENRKEYCATFEITKIRKSCESLSNEVSSKLKASAKVSVMCEAAAIRRHLGYRCQGHGVDGKTTRFSLLAFPQCHGRWQRLKVAEKCELNADGSADFIFV